MEKKHYKKRHAFGKKDGFSFCSTSHKNPKGTKLIFKLQLFQMSLFFSKKLFFQTPFFQKRSRALVYISGITTVSKLKFKVEVYGGKQLF